MTVVVGYLPTAEGSAAVDAAITAAQTSGSRLLVVNTGEAGDDSTASFASGQDLDALSAQLEGLGMAFEIRQRPAGRSAAVEILAAAAESNAELVVIGIRRRSPVGKLFLGSTAQDVLLGADCAVLAVKPPRRGL